MIMAVLWKRINDTGKNWRHVYKVLCIVLALLNCGSVGSDNLFSLISLMGSVVFVL